VTKVERLSRADSSYRARTEESRFVTTPEWGRAAPGLERPGLERPGLERPGLERPNPRLESQRKAKDEAKRQSKEEGLETAPSPTLPTGQPRMRGVNILLTVLALIGCIHIVVMMGIELNRMVASQQEITRLTLETRGLEQEVAGLQSVLDNGDDPAYREQLARKAGFAYPDEVRYLSVPSASVESEATTNQP
jgi:cell division protein FtsB